MIFNLILQMRLLSVSASVVLPRYYSFKIFDKHSVIIITKNAITFQVHKTVFTMHCSNIPSSLEYDSFTVSN